jgi:hypothetical protein
MYPGVTYSRAAIDQSGRHERVAANCGQQGLPANPSTLDTAALVLERLAGIYDGLWARVAVCPGE